MKAVKKRVYKFFERTTFSQIFAVWILSMVLFAGIFYFVTFNPENTIMYLDEPITHDLHGFWTVVYFSFITATTAGFGDIIPLGISKYIAVFEMIVGLVIFGLVISKLVSVKQEVILEEIYNISFEERINRLRSALYLYRADVSKAIDKIDSNVITKQEVSDMWITLTALDVTLTDIVRLMTGGVKKQNNDYIKRLDKFSTDLLLNSIELSLGRTRDLFQHLNINGYGWKTESISENTASIISTIEAMLVHYRTRSINKNLRAKFRDTHILINHIKSEFEKGKDFSSKTKAKQTRLI